MPASLNPFRAVPRGHTNSSTQTDASSSADVSRRATAPSLHPKHRSRSRTLSALAAVVTIGLLTGCAEAAEPAVDTAASSPADPIPTQGTADATNDGSPSDGAESADTDSNSHSDPNGNADSDSHTDEGKAGSSTPGTASAMLGELTVKGRAPKTGYDGDLFKWRSDTDRNGCDTRNDVLRRDLKTITLKAGTRGCIVLAGTLADPYAGETYDFDRGANSVDIDHIVARSNAWQTGAFKFDEEKLKEFGNDPLNLLAVSSSLNRQKGDGDAATWLPPNTQYRCEYVARQIAIKHKYALWVVKAEKDAMTRVLSKCDDQPAFTEDVDWPNPGDGDNATTKEETRPAKQKSSGPSSKSSGSGSSSSAKQKTTPFENCTAAREAGAAPVHRGDPGYGSHLDRDGDGVGCE